MRRASNGNGTAPHLHFAQPDVRDDAETERPEDLPASETVTPGVPGGPHTSVPGRPVTPLHAVQLTPSQTTSGRSVQMASAAEVERMLNGSELTTFHVFRTFDYSVTLLFYPKELKYFVALSQEGCMWRTLTTFDLNTAKQLFHHMQEQATRLADGETRRVQLEAQNEQLKRMIAESETQAERLRQGLQRTAAQDQAVSAKQHQLRKEVAQLEAQRTPAQAQLNKMHRQLHQLNVASNEVIPDIPR
jgi:hypothetical protein